MIHEELHLAPIWHAGVSFVNGINQTNHSNNSVNTQHTRKQDKERESERKRERKRESVYVCRERLVERYERDDKHGEDTGEVREREKRKIDC